MSLCLLLPPRGPSFWFCTSFILPKLKGQLKCHFLHAAFLDSLVEVTYASSEPHNPLPLSHSIIILWLEVDCTWLLSFAKIQVPWGLESCLGQLYSPHKTQDKCFHIMQRGFQPYSTLLLWLQRNTYCYCWDIFINTVLSFSNRNMNIKNQ